MEKAMAARRKGLDPAILRPDSTPRWPACAVASEPHTLTFYEKVRITAARARQLEANDPPRVPFEAAENLVTIAHRELEAGLLDFTVRRPTSSDTSRQA